MDVRLNTDPFQHILYNISEVLRTVFQTPDMLAEDGNPYLFKATEDGDIAQDSKLFISVKDDNERIQKEFRPMILVDVGDSVAIDRRMISEDRLTLDLRTGDSSHYASFQSFIRLTVRHRNKIECGFLTYLTVLVFLENHNYLCKNLAFMELGRRVFSYSLPRRIEESASTPLYESQINISAAIPINWYRSAISRTDVNYSELDLKTNFFVNIRGNK